MVPHGAEASRRCDSHGDLELVSDTVLLQGEQPPGDGANGEFSAFPHTVSDDQGTSKDAIFQRLQRERVVLLCDLNSIKAKFDLTLQTLRAALRLSADASWADVMEQAEALGNAHYPSSLVASGSRPTITDAEAEQAELEREAMEEKLESHTCHISRLRELLQKQQRLLDMTASQIQEQHQQSKRQAEQAVSVEQHRSKEQERSAGQVVRIDELAVELERKKEELKMQRDLARQLEEQLCAEVQQRHENSVRQESTFKREAERATDLREQLTAREADVKRYRSDCEKQKHVLKELTDSLQVQNEAYEELRGKVEVHEAENRRHDRYQTRTPDHRRLNAGADDIPSPGTSVTASPPATAPGTAPGSSKSARGKSSTSARQEQPNGTFNGYSGPTAVPVGPWCGDSQASVPSSARGPPQSARQVEMDDDERDAFLSHFPMASRTERNIRNRLDGERRKKAGRR